MMSLENYKFVQPLYESTTTTLFRGVRRADSKRVLGKFVGDVSENIDAVHRLRHEHDVLSALSIDGIPKVLGLESHELGLIMEMEDPGGKILDDMVAGSSLPMSIVLRIGRQMATLLVALKEANLVHQQFRLPSLLFDPLTLKISLLDFGTASGAPVLSAFHGISDPEICDPIYISPEQTGRLERAVDHRADYYALGVCLYRLLTGCFPFRGETSLELIHQHLAGKARPPAERIDGLPKVLSDIVMKLLSKMPEDRYQSAYGIGHDLTHCLSIWKRKGEIPPFPLARKDVPVELILSDKLFGRNHQRTVLSEAFDKAMTGNLVLCLVSGFSGTGKSMLVKEMGPSVHARGGLFVSGKFDQSCSSEPFTAVSKALHQRCEQILGLPKDQIETWRQRIKTALGQNTQLAMAIVPSLAMILGREIKVGTIKSFEMKNRLQVVITGMMKAFCTVQSPLTMFIDNLHWADDSSIELLQMIIGEVEIRHLLLVVVYRTKQMPSDHPFLKHLSHITNPNLLQKTICLENFSTSDCAEFIDHSFFMKADQSRHFASVIHQKTDGNPFFMHQLIHRLYEEELFYFNKDRGAWQWKPQKTRAASVTDNVAGLLLERLSSLDEETMNLLSIGSAIGNCFDLVSVAAMSGQDAETIEKRLVSALNTGVLLGKIHRRYASNPNRVNGRPKYQFAHDKIQEVVYSMLNSENSIQIHARIGMWMFNSMSDLEHDADAFRVADHLNLGFGALGHRKDRIIAAAANLSAAKKARKMAAHQACLAYSRKGLQALNSDSWDHNYDVCFHLFREAAQAELTSGVPDRCRQLIKTALPMARYNIDRGLLYIILIDKYNLQGDLDHAVNYVGQKALKLMDIEFPGQNKKEQVYKELARIDKLISSRSLHSFETQPEMTDQQHKIALKLLIALDPPAYAVDSALYSLIVLKAVEITIHYGPIADSAKAWASYGIVINLWQNNHGKALIFSQLGITISLRFNDLSLQCKAYHTMCNAIQPWVEHIRLCDENSDRGLAAGIEGGENFFAGQISGFRLFNHLFAGYPLETVNQEAVESYAFTRRIRNELFRDCSMGVQIGLAQLTGIKSQAQMNRKEFESYCIRNNNTFVLLLFKILQLEVDYLMDPSRLCAASVLDLKPSISMVTGLISSCEYYFFSALILMDQCVRRTGEDQTSTLNEIKECILAVEGWARHCPDNFEPRYLILKGAFANLTGNKWEAVQAFDKAIAKAEQNEFCHIAAIGCELAARFWVQHSKLDFAESYFEKAIAYYTQWQCPVKVDKLRKKYQDGFGSAGKTGSTDVLSAPRTLDFQTLLKATRAISEEGNLTALVPKIMHIVIENACAQKGYLVLEKDGRWMVSAQARAQEGMVSSFIPEALDDSGLLSREIVQSVAGHKKKIILENASVAGVFCNTEYISAHGVKSVFCLPLLNRSELSGILYLENNLSSGVFNKQRETLLTMLSGQLAISLDHARLLSAYRQELEEHRQTNIRLHSEITERRKIETELKRSETHLKTILDVIPDLVWMKDQEGIYLFCNSKFERLLGAKESDIIGKSDHDFFLKEPADLYRKADLAVISTNQPLVNDETVNFADDGHEEVLETIKTPVHDTHGNVTGVLGIARDITQRKKREQALKESQARFEKLIAKSPLPMAITDANQDFVFLNEKFTELFGYSLDDISTAKQWWQMAYPDEAYRNKVRRSLTAGIEKAKVGQSDVDMQEWEMSTKDRSRVVCEFHIVPLDEIGLTIINDVTERRRMEAYLLQSQKMDSIGTLAGGIAHDFNNILVPIIGNAEMLIENVKQDSPAKAGLNEILTSAIRAKDLVKQILTFARSEQPEKKQMMIQPILNETLALLRSTTPTTIEFVTEIDSRCGAIEADPIHIQQTLMNLLTNACHAITENTGRVNVVLKEVELKSHTCMNSKMAPGRFNCITISDTGIGMDRETQSRIFEPFFTTKEKGKGTGMGLSVVHGILKNINSGIEVFSEPTRGTTVSVYIPVVETDIPAEKFDENQPDPRGNERILIVDDEPAILKITNLMLSRMGYTVSMSANGFEALDILRGNPDRFDLVITDMNMPGMPGDELARKLKKIRPEIPIILCTGYNKRISPDIANEKGFQRILVKPIVKADMARMIRQTLDENQ